MQANLLALPLSGWDWRQWRVPVSTLAVGVYGLFGLLFVALRHAPPVQANLVNYLWPLGMVVMAPWFLAGKRVTLRHGAAALLCHFWLETPADLSLRDWLLMVLWGLGPLGGAFFLWDVALKRNDAQQIAVLSFLTPWLSTLVLLALAGQAPASVWCWPIVSAAVVAQRA